MKALDTNVIIRFLVNDEKTQGLKVQKLFEDAEATAQRFLVTTPVVLEVL